MDATLLISIDGVVGRTDTYIWKRKFGSLQESDVKRLRELEKENARLKRILAEHVVEIDAMKELIAKKL
jgi:putative transposase